MPLHAPTTGILFPVSAALFRRSRHALQQALFDNLGSFMPGDVQSPLASPHSLLYRCRHHADTTNDGSVSLQADCNWGLWEYSVFKMVSVGPWFCILVALLLFLAFSEVQNCITVTTIIPKLFLNCHSSNRSPEKNVRVKKWIKLISWLKKSILLTFGLLAVL